MKKAIEKAVAQFLLQTTNSEHAMKTVGSKRHGATFHGGSESEEFSLEMNHISQELHHQLSSAINVDAAAIEVLRFRSTMLVVC